MIGERNNWYIDEKGNTVLYLGPCEFKREYTQKVAGCWLKKRPSEIRHLYIHKENCLKWFTETELNTLSIEEILKRITEQYLYSSASKCLMFPKKPRELKKFIKVNMKEIKEGDIYQFKNVLDTITYEFV